MFDFILQNKEWLFSGVGVSLLTAVFFLIKYILSRHRHTSAPAPRKINTTMASSNPAPPSANLEDVSIRFSQYLPTPTPQEIEEEIEKVTPFQRRAAKENYVGLKVRWETHLLLAHPLKENAVSLGCRYEGYSRLVLIETDLREYPFLRVAKNGQPIVVYGTITGIDPNGPMVKADKLEFSEQGE